MLDVRSAPAGSRAALSSSRVDLDSFVRAIPTLEDAFVYVTGIVTDDGNSRRLEWVRVPEGEGWPSVREMAPEVRALYELY